MSNVITEWREAVQTHLDTTFPDATVVGGRRDGVNREKQPMICVWWPGWQAMQRDIALANPTLVIRFFPSLSKQPSPTSPRDQEPLEEAAVDLMAAMEPKRKAGDFVVDLACYVSAVTPNPAEDAWYVEAILQAYTLNVAARAG